MLRLYRRLTGQQGPEECYSIKLIRELDARELDIIRWLIADTAEEITCEPQYSGEAIEVGPRLSVETPFSSNAVGICERLALPVVRIERSIRYPAGMAEPKIDPLTQEIYPRPLASFDTEQFPEPVRYIPLLESGEGVLAEANKTLGLGMDTADLAYYASLFRRLGRNPTDVELFQLGNGNSEHSRHHFFRGIQIIDGVKMPESLMEVMQKPWKVNEGNSLVAFHDNSGVIRGRTVKRLIPGSPFGPSGYHLGEVVQHITSTAETHNHPTLIAPFPGAETGAGGRIRDNRAVGRGGLAHAGVAGYCVGNLHIPGYAIPGEEIGGEECASHASPLHILIDGSNGISDYSNKIGEPLLGGFVRTFGQIVGDNRVEFRKPVLYTGGLGRIDGRHLYKRPAEPGMFIVRIGGPAFRIGVGGGSASSMQGGNLTELDLKSVQRGDAEMENRVNRVIQACAEMGDENPIESIHDQGAGGPSNVLTELMEPAGGRIDIRKIALGDRTMSVLEIWGAEYQEGYGLLVNLENIKVLLAICERERVNCEVLGQITGDGDVVVFDSNDDTTPVNLAINDILSNVPRKEFPSEHLQVKLTPLVIPEGLTVEAGFRLILKLPHIGSKRFLAHKIDRSVTGLVAQQSCCGPMQVTVADVGVTADSYFGLSGAAEAIGEQPIKMLVSPGAGARMAVTEMVTNMASARISSLEDITCRANWMWAAKLPNEGARLWDAAVATRNFMIKLGIKNDGGKDSASMSVKIGDTLVISPGELVIKGYAPVPDITKIVTPDLKGSGCLGLITLGGPHARLGGSALAQALGQLGDEVPDVDDAKYLASAFRVIQELIEKDLITAYHDCSDGGLITAVAEMCIAGNRGARLRYNRNLDAFPTLFSEEAGMLFEFSPESRSAITRVMSKHRVTYQQIGTVSPSEGGNFCILSGTERLLDIPVTAVRECWEETSTALEMLQANPETVRKEHESFGVGKSPPYRLTFTPKPSPSTFDHRPNVAILREEGTNGDAEMVAACMTAGLNPWNINMEDILSGKITSFDNFRGIIFPGGFSYADVFGSARGWAALVRFHEPVRAMFDQFYDRKNTFTLGVCNGCQLMANIGWLPGRDIAEGKQPRLVHNRSGRFESRWSTVRILPSPSIFFKGMEGSVLGIHVAHGEGRFRFSDPMLAGEIWAHNLAPVVFIDPEGKATERYPYNPNGSPDGFASICSRDGRHLAMMPHPERCFLPWQWPYMPQEWRASLTASPWLQMFQNVRTWCLEHP